MNNDNNDNNNNKPTIITFRKHMHAIPLSEANVIDWSNPPSFIPSALIPLINIALGIFASSYLFWVIPILIIFFYLYLCGYYYIPIIITLLYLPSFFNNCQYRFGAPSDFIRTLPLWRYMQRYGYHEIIRLSPPLDPKKQYIFGFYPHNLLILSRVSMYGGVLDTLFPGLDMRVLGASTMFFVPLCRELCLALGAVDAGRKTADRVLKYNNNNDNNNSTTTTNNNNDNKITPTNNKIITTTKKNNKTTPFSLMLYPGGVAEMLVTDNKKNNTEIIARKGFIRLAIENGSNLVPAYVFNEEKCYKRSQSALLKNSEKLLWKKFKFPWVWFHGRFCTLLPYQCYDRPLTVIIGHPIEVKKNPTPTEEEINDLYQKFYGAIENIYNTYKEKLGYNKDDQLIIKLAEEKKHHSHHHKEKKNN